jgi:hypothetical protein
MREQPEKCPWWKRRRVRVSGQALMALLLVNFPVGLRAGIEAQTVIQF